MKEREFLEQQIKTENITPLQQQGIEIAMRKYAEWYHKNELSKFSQHDVSGRSEQLCDFLEWYDVDLTLEEIEMEVKTYMDMKSHNCH